MSHFCNKLRTNAGLKILQEYEVAIMEESPCMRHGLGVNLTSGPQCLAHGPHLVHYWLLSGLQHTREKHEKYNCEIIGLAYFLYLLSYLLVFWTFLSGAYPEFLAGTHH